MRVPVMMLCLLAAVAASLQADAARRAAPAQPGTALLTGRLEMVWGDVDAGGASRLRSAQPLHRLSLVDDSGVRHPLDHAKALRAAADLHRLVGKRVAVEVQAPSLAPRGAGKARAAAQPSALMPLAMVPIGDLVPRSRSGRIAARDAAETIAGNAVWVTLPCKFAGLPAGTNTQEFFQAQYDHVVGMKRYWNEVSYGALTLDGSFARDWKALPEPRSGYVKVVQIDGYHYLDADLDKLYRDCVAVHDADVNFAAGDGVYGIMLAFNSDLDGPAWGGQRCEPLDGVDACRGVAWMPPWASGRLGTVGHEFGHGFGLPHADNSDRDDFTYDNPWEVMSSSSLNARVDSTFGTIPKHINAYSRLLLGWMPASRVRTVRPGEAPVTVTLDRLNLPTSNNTQVLVLRDPARPDRYYTLEARIRSGYYDDLLAGDAVIAYEVDEGRRSPSWSLDADVPPADVSNNEGSMFKPGEIWVSPDHLFRVRVDAATATGFRVTVLPIPRKSGPHPALRVETPAPVSAPAAPAPVRPPAAAGTARRPDRR